MSHRAIGPTVHNLLQHGLMSKRLATSYDPTVKPVTPHFNASHPLASGLLFAYLMNEGVGSGAILADSAGKMGNATLTGGTWGTDTMGAKITLNGTSDKITLPTIIGLTNGVSTQASLLYIIKVKASKATGGNGNVGLEDFGGAFDDYYPLGGGNSYVGAFRNNRVDAIAAGSQDKAVWHHLLTSTKPGASNYRVLQNGVLWSGATATGESVITIPSSPKFGVNNTNSFFFDGDITTIMGWSSALTDQQALDLVADAWAAFQ